MKQEAEVIESEVQEQGLFATLGEVANDTEEVIEKAVINVANVACIISEKADVIIENAQKIVTEAVDDVGKAFDSLSAEAKQCRADANAANDPVKVVVEAADVAGQAAEIVVVTTVETITGVVEEIVAVVEAATLELTFVSGDQTIVAKLQKMPLGLDFGPQRKGSCCACSTTGKFIVTKVDSSNPALQNVKAGMLVSKINGEDLPADMEFNEFKERLQTATKGLIRV